MFSQKTVDPKFTKEQFNHCQEIQSIVQTGDIMIQSTNSMPYQALRTLLNVQYDHLSVFLDKDNLIHISWPRVRLIHPLNLLSNIRDFKIVRPSFQNDNERSVFLNILKSSIDAPYDLQLMLKQMTNKFKANLPNSKTQYKIDFESKDLQLPKSQICTGLIFYALSVASPTFKVLLQDSIQFLDYRLMGSFSTDDLNVLVTKNSFFTLIKDQQNINNSPKIVPNLLTTFHLSELTKLIKGEDQSSRTHQKITFHCLMLIAIGIHQGPKRPFKLLDDEKSGLIKVAQDFLRQRKPKL